MRRGAALAAVTVLLPAALVGTAVLGIAGAATAGCTAGGTGATGAAVSADTAAVASAVRTVLGNGPAERVHVPGLSDPAQQVPNARTVQATGVAMHVPARGQVVALATALQESGLRNLPYGDRDSLGLFQQRPSQGWGTAGQILDPVHASARFYAALLKVPGWQRLTVARAAQAVQRSAFPGTYARWEPLAGALQQVIAPTLAPVGSEGGSSSGPVQVADLGPLGCADGTNAAGPEGVPPGSLPDGYTVPADAPPQVQAAIRWALGRLGTPYQWGGSCTAPRGADPMGRCDCSSLVQQAYRAGGVPLSRTTYTQVGEGRAVSVDALRPGDLLFTEGTAAAPGHVGMFIGAGLVVHAPHTGDVVRIATLASWRPRVLAARRVTGP
ncbi:C40 family peptidase [Streptomyces sp. NPDC001380]|uniref:C40 family peptidase n=1 Tax=Streptomyces sp. NPDC001380 TaxID=3364566 RepID=UPI0036C24934